MEFANFEEFWKALGRLYDDTLRINEAIDKLREEQRESAKEFREADRELRESVKDLRDATGHLLSVVEKHQVVIESHERRLDRTEITVEAVLEDLRAAPRRALLRSEFHASISDGNLDIQLNSVLASPPAVGDFLHTCRPENIQVPMRYLPKSESDREVMLREIGAKSIDDLFAAIPPEYRLKGDLNIPRAYAESEIVEFFRDCATGSAQGYATFLGAGAYSHYRPVVIDSLVSRGEFFTAYTPYQPEIAQGTLQSIFEFQTMICELTGMDVANASMYDGSTGAAEALMMAARLTGRHKSVIATSVHPEYREVIATYARYQGMPISTVGYQENGRVDLRALDQAIDNETAGVLIQSPNFFGTIEDIAAIADIVHKKGALLIVSIAEAVSLGIVKPPVEADIVSMEAQSFGVPLGFGGPYCGVMATREKFVRQIPGRLVGQT